MAVVRAGTVISNPASSLEWLSQETMQVAARLDLVRRTTSQADVRRSMRWGIMSTFCNIARGAYTYPHV